MRVARAKGARTRGPCASSSLNAVSGEYRYSDSAVMLSTHLLLALGGCEKVTTSLLHDGGKVTAGFTCDKQLLPDPLRV